MKPTGTNIKQASTKPNRNRTNLWVDITIFLGFLLALSPHFTGTTIHEWLGFSLTAGVMTHLLLHWRWIIEIAKRFVRSAQWSARINYILNTILFLDVIVIICSGLMISEVVVPLVGITHAKNDLWHTLHTDAANVFLYLMGLHVALHWQWVVNMIKRLGPISRRLPKRAADARPSQGRARGQIGRLGLSDDR